MKSGMAKWILGGWQLNGILTLSKGEPYNVVSGQDRALTGAGSERPNVVGNPHLDTGRSTNQLLAQYYNPAAYTLPPLGSYGNSGRNTLIAPGVTNLDSSLFKMIPIREDVKLQFRAEFFNSLNNVNFAAPVTNISTATAGNILSASSPRILQFALRLAF